MTPRVFDQYAMLAGDILGAPRPSAEEVERAYQATRELIPEAPEMEKQNE